MILPSQSEQVSKNDVPRVCDCHMHFLGDKSTYPAGFDPSYTPKPAAASDYSKIQSSLNVRRVICVQSKIYRFDHEVMLSQMALLDAETRGVAVVAKDIQEYELTALHEQGIRAIRLFLDDHGSVYDWGDIEWLETIANRMRWHLEIRLNGQVLPDTIGRLKHLSVPLVIDHFARFQPMVDPEHPAFMALLRLIDAGNCWVKLSAPYASSQSKRPFYQDVSLLARKLVECAPERLLWGSNWPHTTLRSPLSAEELGELAENWMPNAGIRNRIQWINPAEVYDF